MAAAVPQHAAAECVVLGPNTPALFGTSHTDPGAAAAGIHDAPQEAVKLPLLCASHWLPHAQTCGTGGVC